MVVLEQLRFPEAGMISEILPATGRSNEQVLSVAN